MALRFRQVTSPPLDRFDAAAPDGVVIGIVGENGAGQSRLLEIAAGSEHPTGGSFEATGAARLLGPADSLDFLLKGQSAPVLLIDHTFARLDLLMREQASTALDRLRRAGTTVLLVSHEEELLRRLCDEIWWLHDGKLADRGEPQEILCGYRRHIAARLRAWGEARNAPLAPRIRQGDGRAEVLRIETIGEKGLSTMIWRSGELAVIRICVRFRERVEDPVIGMMIRTRIGLNVYGTNTELERLKLGPCAAGENIEIRFAFRCELCPGEYTLTVASHDPDGVWHDWLEDAIAFSVVDNRYTAGIANLRAQVTLWNRG